MIRYIFLSILVFSMMGTAKPSKWKQLFNGKNLNGWQMKIAGYPLG
ncbi:MAG: hypothetical protein SFU87_01195 [Chitinophagaceae bacterium]|nr:hypothetical protein [Chitinophagaceae bacterium]